MPKRDEFNEAGESLGHISLDQAALRARECAKEEEPDILTRVGWGEIVWEENDKQHNEDSYRVLLQFRRPGHSYRVEQTGLMEFIFDLRGTQLEKQFLAWPRPAPQTKVSQVKGAFTNTIPARTISMAASKAASGLLSRGLGIRRSIRRPLSRPTLLGRIAVVQGDITIVEVDAIVNAANNSLLGGARVDGAIHRAAGPELLRECRSLGGCETGEAKITGGYNLPARWVIHTVGPVWEGGANGEADLLARCYQSCLSLAVKNSIKTIAFPAISTGAYGFPMELATRIAVDEVSKFLMTNSLVEKVTFVCFNERANRAYTAAVRELAGG